VLSLAIVAIALIPTRGAAVAQAPADFAHVEGIFKARCLPCHSATPTQPGFMAPPKGIEFDTAERIIENVARTQPQLLARSMPPGNLTGMTEEERALVLSWIDHGAHR
jgi:uncharacterized membrane protein